MLGNKTGDDMKIFSGNANPDLAREIAAYLGTQVGMPSSTVSTTAKFRS